MLNYRWLFLSVLVSTSGLARVDFKTKQARVDSLMKLQKFAPAFAFDNFQRELEYEKKGLSLEARAKNEADLLADQIRARVADAYEAALKKYENAESAREEVRAAINKDLSLVAPGLRDELSLLAHKTLDQIENGISSEGAELIKVQESFKKDALSRSVFLNQEFSPADFESNQKMSNPPNDSERKEYNNKQEIIESLTSEKESSRWVSSSNLTVRTAEITSTSANVSMQLKVSFLGATINAGPSIRFKKTYSTNATIMADGMNPIFVDGGNFDYHKRDKGGKILVKNGKQQKRYMFFTCDADLSFETDYEGSGGFSFMGVGGNASVTKKFMNHVDIASRRIALPEYVNNKSVTVKFISELCHNDFLGARFNNSLTVKNSLDMMMKSVVEGLTFSHPKTKCAIDEHCYDWFNYEIISLVKNKNFPRCREESAREQYMSCQLRGLEGQNCPVYENGKRTSNGQWEYQCDTGLKCVKYESQSFFLGRVWEYAKGKCQVINKKTYRNPFDLANENREIGVEIELAN
jgi:hypothetical protein